MRLDLRDERPERDAHAVGNHNLAVFVEAIDGQPLEVISMLHPLRRDDADLGQMPRNALSAAVRWPASNSRARWRINSVWFSIDRTRTVGPVASQIAAASTVSFLLRRT
jgi:hypothetical protein